ncbi:peptidoglycan recognition protein-lc [Culex quinquefasciatus]|uniref:Peptidoglycan recognition protein-lc n=1 Tax=Culex quinquefasciatus TaxID=7176 RepID=B0WH91_CULQU|nr:peptidoglycan recognition protein-lc [Culex quinquefasciatus]|eukprot:XP_001848056.1 peptidoglycan recognition protein-lc [Culex quinquefasciatus]
MAKNDNCEISLDKQIHSKDQDAESGISKKHRESTSKAAESSPFAGVLDVLARNKPILDVLSSQCVAMTSRIQGFHMAPDSKNFSDIAYNFLVGADGNIYEGRGWDKRGAHTRGFNKDSICIAFIGTFNDEEASEPQLRAARRLIAMGVEQGMIDSRYRLYGQRQLAPFSSPGEKLYQQIKVWPNWSSELGPRHWESEMG